MEDASAIFVRLQPRMLGMAYRMLGSLSEAEDVVQDVWLRWHDTDADKVDNAEAWLVSATMRRAIDHLRLARRAREEYVGIWLPEPVLTDGGDAPSTPEQLHEAAGDLSIAFLTVLERLSPDARAAFLLHEVFEAGYPEIADVLGKSEAATRQVVHRAKKQLRDQRPVYAVSGEAHRHVLQGFVDRLSRGDLEGMKALMSESATLLGDGGGVVTSVPEPMHGGDRIAALLFAATLRYKRDLRLELAMLNGKPGLLRFVGGRLESAQSFDIEGDRVQRIYVQLNPAKLQRVARHRVAHLR